MKKKGDELILALEEMLEVAPDGATLRWLFEDHPDLDKAPMSPEEFVDFCRTLVKALKSARKKGKL